MRFDGPIENSLSRVPLADIEIGGTVIKAGEGVAQLGFGRQPRPGRLPGPEPVRHRQAPPSSASATASACASARPLARMEADVALRALLARFPSLDLAIASEGIQWRPALTRRGPVSLPVTWNT